MSQDQIVALLLGPLGLLVGSLLLNYLQARGVILSRKVVSVERYEALQVVNTTYAEKFPLLIEAVARLAAAVDKLPKRR